MTFDPEQGNSEQESQNSTYSVKYGKPAGQPVQQGVNGDPIHGRGADDANFVNSGASPDLLRWRADQLLDEMMLGGVDVSAADSAAKPAIDSVIDYGESPGSLATGSARNVSSNAPSSVPSPQPSSPVASSPATIEPPHRSPAIDPARNDGQRDGRYSQPSTHGLGQGASSHTDHSGNGHSEHARPNGNGSGNGEQYGSSNGKAYLLDDSFQVDSPGDRVGGRKVEGGFASGLKSGGADGSLSARGGNGAPNVPDIHGEPETENEQDIPTGGQVDYDERLFSAHVRYEQLSQQSRELPSPQSPTPISPNLPDGAQQVSQEQHSQNQHSQVQHGQAQRGNDPWAWQEYHAPVDEPMMDGSSGSVVHGSEAATGSVGQQAENGIARNGVVGTPINSDPRHPKANESVGASMHPAVDPTVDSAVRQDSMQYVSAMSVMANSKKRSTLLPRMSVLDVDALNEEIASLHGEIGTILPIGHESAERARHLLEKAHSIFQSDPMRSAEVEYYMQQVRTIVGRVRQTRLWSDLYRDRLRIYLLAWFFLSCIVLVARVLFSLEMDAFFASVMGLSFDGMSVRHVSPLITALFAGSLGGATGALITMYQHAHREHGFFDRKYSLRGLMLPIIGMFAGLLIYVVFAVAYQMLNVDPALNVFAATLPALLAFAFGFAQESIYGTRD